MLVLGRREGEKIVVDGGIVITVAYIDGNKVGIGVDAPPDAKILRGELTDRRSVRRRTLD